MRKASFSVEKATSNTDAHNTREHPPKYLLGCEEGKENEYIKFYDYDNFRELAETRYVEVNKQKMQQKQKDNMFEEALISMEEHHTKDDIIKLFEALNKKYTGHTLINLAIHRDEGHFLKDGIEYYPAMHILQKDDGWYTLDENDTEILEALKDKDFKPKNEDFKIKVDINDFTKVYNYHAHAVFSRFDLELGKNARFDKKTMSERYKFVAEEMQMKYAPSENRLIKKSIGQHKTDLSATRNAKLVIKKELENEHQKEIEQLKSQIQELKNENKNLKTQNTKLKNANETLKFDKKELEEQLKKLNAELREKLKENGAVRADYAQLEALNKELKEELKNKVLSHDKLLKSFNNLEDILIKKDSEILTLKDENKVQNLQILQLQKENEHQKSLIEVKEVEILELQNKLSLAQKKSQSYFGLNKELKEEIIALKEQINDLEEQKEDLEEKVIDLEEKIDLKANTDDLSSTKKEDYLKEIVNQYDSKKPNFEKLKEIQKKNSLSSKLQEVDKQQELEAPVKKRSFRER